jgi:tetratricopeptide (TPR) repeat protein
MISLRPLCLFALAALVSLGAPSRAPARAAGLDLPPDAVRARDFIYSNDIPSAVSVAHSLEQSMPNHPIGFLLEGEAEWWDRYCGATEIKYGMVEAWRRSKEPGDEAYLALADHAIQLAEVQLAKADTAEMHVYAGFGLALKTRVYAIRGENHNAARVAVAARAEMLRALQLDPENGDATAALGIYNYYVDTLSPIVKLLRIFMGIPGGDKQLGVKQMKEGMARGSLLDVDVRFILARALRQYDQKYEEALTIALPLLDRYPRNPEFLLLVGNLSVESGHEEKAKEYFQAVLNLPPPASACSSCSDCPPCGTYSCLAHSRDLANTFLTGLH